MFFFNLNEPLDDELTHLINFSSSIPEEEIYCCLLDVAFVYFSVAGFL